MVSSTNKTDHHDITELLLKVALNTIKHIYGDDMCKLDRKKHQIDRENWYRNKNHSTSGGKNTRNQS